VLTNYKCFNPRAFHSDNCVKPIPIEQEHNHCLPNSFPFPFWATYDLSPPFLDFVFLPPSLSFISCKSKISFLESFLSFFLPTSMNQCTARPCPFRLACPSLLYIVYYDRSKANEAYTSQWRSVSQWRTLNCCSERSGLFLFCPSFSFDLDFFVCCCKEISFIWSNFFFSSSLSSRVVLDCSSFYSPFAPLFP